MSVAYVDSSVLVAIALGEPGGAGLAEHLASFSRLCSSHLLEAELRSALAREGVEYSARHTAHLNWISPSRSLGSEMAAALKVGYLRGADLWHVAVALYAAAEPRDVAFVSLDVRQRDVARNLGFAF